MRARNDENFIYFVLSITDDLNILCILISLKIGICIVYSDNKINVKPHSAPPDLFTLPATCCDIDETATKAVSKSSIFQHFVYYERTLLNKMVVNCIM